MARPVINKAVAVGVLGAVCGIAFLIAFTFFRKGGYSDSDSYRISADFEDATGLTWKSRVQIAGIQVGEVDKIVLQGNRARLELRIRKDIDVRADGCVTKRFPSALLPDALLDLAPGTERKPSLRAMPQDQRVLTCVVEGTTVAKLLDSMSKIANDVQNVTHELSDMVSGSQGSIKQIIENLEKMSSSINDTVQSGQDKVQAILDNTESFTGTIAEVAESDRERYHAIAKNMELASGRLAQVLASVQGLLGNDEKGGGDLRKSIADARESLAKLNATMDQVNKIATKVGEGKSIAGKLLTDERLGQKFGDTVETVTDYVDKLNKLQIKVNLRSEWLLNQSGAKTYAGFHIIPRPDKYYILEVVNDPRGATSQQVQDLYTTTPTGVPVKTTTTTIQNDQKITFSLEFAKRYSMVTFRVGLIESSGGAGADLHLLQDRLTLSLNLYQFWRPGPNVPTFPRAKVWADYHFLKYFYVTGGTDDFLNPWRKVNLPGGATYTSGQDIFFGGGIAFTDDDIKTLISGAGSGVGSATSH
jgi:phospholipid/cholesterol/gamma-HCH transport system substrate-binding protein